MTYLGCPRFHFAGRFFADPSTVNNLTVNFRNGRLDRNVAWQRDSSLGLWNPGGHHSWRFEGVTVTSAVGSDGLATTEDAAVGMRFVSAGVRPAKLVDLDVDQQLVSTIFGLVVELVDDDNVLFEAAMEPVAFTDLWGRSGGQGDGSLSAAYQSTLTVTQWGDLSASPLLTELRAAAADDLLSIKFNVDRYSMDFGPDQTPSSDFARGRIVGTVGAAAAGEPAHLVVGRQFGTAMQPGNVNFFPGVVDAGAGRIRLDLGNALPDVTATSPDLVLAARADDGTTTDLAPIDHRAPGWYETSAGIVDLPVEPAAVATRSLLVLARQDGQEDVLIAETPVHVRADEFVARLDPGDEWVARLYVTERGRPVPNRRVNLQLTLPRNAAGQVPSDFPQAGLTFPASVTTDADGIAEATFVAADPGPTRYFYRLARPRQFVDGQVYRVAYQVDGVAPTNPSNVLSLLVWNTFVADDPPTWHGGIGAIFTSYGDLYPSMTEAGPRLDLAEYDQVAARRVAIARSLRRDVKDARYMPVTRDLSGSRKQALLTWLESPGPDGLPLLGDAPEAMDVAGPPAAEQPTAEPPAEPADEFDSKTNAARGVGILPT